MNYSHRIAEALTLRNKSAFQVAKEMGVGRTAIDDIVRGRSKDPRISTLLGISEALDVSLEFLIGETDDPANAPPPRKSAEPLTLIALEANATPTFPDPGRPTVLVALQTTTHGEVGVLLPPREAAWLADRLKDAAKEIAVRDSIRSSPPSASAS